MTKITKQVQARVALVGNPSDGFGGKTIAVPIKNFSAKVILTPTDNIIFKPNSQDKLEHSNIAELTKDVRQHGYYGGLRLLKAATKKFYEYCQEHEIEIDESKGFMAEYQTNIPRQMGLGGSSALIIACLKCLIELYQVTENQLPKPILANLALKVETEELDISAGLQDRVVQTYNCPIYMDFSKRAFRKNLGEYGIYKTLKQDMIPPLFLIYSDAPSESGKVHSKVGFRFKKGEKLVVNGMKQLAKLTDQALGWMKDQNWDELDKIFNQNFKIRRKIYGDPVIGKRNFEMIQLPRKQKLSSKFSGSGGGIIGIWQTEEELDKLKQTGQKEGFVVEKVII